MARGNSLQTAALWLIAAAAVVYVGTIVWNRSHEVPSTQSDLTVLKAQREGEEISELANRYPEAGITKGEPLVDALRAALHASEARDGKPAASTPSQSGSQAARIVNGG